MNKPQNTVIEGHNYFARVTSTETIPLTERNRDSTKRKEVIRSTKFC